MHYIRKHISDTLLSEIATMWHFYEITFYCIIKNISYNYFGHLVLISYIDYTTHGSSFVDYLKHCILISFPFHCVKSVYIRNFSGPYFPAFGLNTERPNAGKYGPEKLRIRTLFTQCLIEKSAPVSGSIFLEI